MTRTERAEVVVVGCGPGGAVLAYLLARSGVEVALVERAATFQREYRGFGWPPGVVRLFDGMGLLEDVLGLAHETVTEGGFVLGGRRVGLLALDRLDTAYPYVLMMEQPALLELLVERARGHDGFSFHPATTVTDLRTGDGAGVLATDREAGEEVAIDGRVVVGADGRYSTVRERAGIDPGTLDSPVELAWFKLPADAVTADALGYLGSAGVVVSFGLGGGERQVGCLLRDGEYARLRERGFDAFRDRVAAVAPAYGAAVDAHLEGFGDVTLLDIAPGMAETWVRDGLLLLGDAAHTASPLGAQGNPLAVADSVVAHDLLVGALREESGVLPAGTLGAFERRRRPTVERVIDGQRRGGDALALWLDYGQYVPDALLRALGAGVDRLPAGWLAGAVESFALGDRSVTVARRWFTE